MTYDVSGFSDRDFGLEFLDQLGRELFARGLPAYSHAEDHGDNFREVPEALGHLINPSASLHFEGDIELFLDVRNTWGLKVCSIVYSRRGVGAEALRVRVTNYECGPASSLRTVQTADGVPLFMALVEWLCESYRDCFRAIAAGSAGFDALCGPCGSRDECLACAWKKAVET